MRKHDFSGERLVLALGLALGFALSGSAALAQRTPNEAAIDAKVNRMLSADHHEKNLLVRFKPAVGAQHRQAAHGAAAAEEVRQFHMVDGLTLVRIPGRGLNGALKKYLANPNVLYAEPDYQLRADAVPDDPRWGDLWGLGNTNGIDAPLAWDVWTGDSDFRIAVVDTGIDWNHPDLGGNIWTNPAEIGGNEVDDDGNGYVDDVHGVSWIPDTEDPTDDPMDFNDHGSHVSGTIGAVGNNGVGVVGVNWSCNLVALKILDSTGGNLGGIAGIVSDACGAMQYIVDNDIKLSNNSWGFEDVFPQTLHDCVEATQAVGHIFVAAAGNRLFDIDRVCSGDATRCCGTNDDCKTCSGSGAACEGDVDCPGAETCDSVQTCEGDGAHYPASFCLDNIITVAATTQASGLWDELNEFDGSNFGQIAVDLGAPGVGIWSTTLSPPYKSFKGTSMAAPHVTGVAGLLMSQHPGLRWDRVKDRILESVRISLPALQNTVTGGILDAGAALDPLGHDCNDNAVADECDIDCQAAGCGTPCGGSADCNANIIPDECEYNFDCNTNSIQDICDIAASTSEDCNNNAVPDECEADCNTNGIDDACDIADGTSQDCNVTGVPDECEPTQPDCNANQIPDGCDISAGTSRDCDINGVPDECEGIVLYVDENASGPTYDGLAWATAFDELTDALTAAPCSFGSTVVTQIWVAEGTYTPDATARHATFQLLDGVAIYGGFDGTESLLSQRNPIANETILSGDVSDDDLPGFVNNDENSYHVVTANGTDSTAVLDGFTITGGNANGGFDLRGGGIFNDFGSPTIINCVISYNSARTRGGGMYNEFGNPTLSQCTLSDNRVFDGLIEQDGGAMFNFGADPVLRDCTISANTARFGGGIYNHGSNPTLTNCALTGNTATLDGGAINDFQSAPVITNCTFDSNTAVRNGGAIRGRDSNVKLTNCLLTGNMAGINGGAAYFFDDSSPTITNCTISENSATNETGGIHDNDSSTVLTIVNSILWNNSDSGGTDESAQVDTGGGSAVDYSCIQGLTGSLGGTGNTGADPLFESPPTNLRVLASSPCIDAGDNNAVPADIADLDEDGDLNEQLPFDLDQNTRINHLTVDMGAYEHPCAIDADCDDGSDCTTESCIAGACTYVNKAAGTSCEDGLFCTAPDTCDGSGTCDSGPGDPCAGPQICCECGIPDGHCSPARTICFCLE